MTDEHDNEPPMRPVITLVPPPPPRPRTLLVLDRTRFLIGTAIVLLVVGGGAFAIARATAACS